MASLWMHPNSSYWMCCYYRADGSRTKKTTKQKNRTKAMEVCLAIERAEQIAKAGAMTEHVAKKIIGEILERTTGETLQNHKAGEWLDEWANGKQGSSADSTAERYKQVVRDFKAVLGTRTKIPLASVSVKDVLAYRQAELTAGKSPKTANNAIKCLSAAFNAALRQHLIPLNPCTAVQPLEEESSTRDVFTPAQLTALLKAADGDWRLAIMFGYYTGARLGDVVAMTWNMIDLKAGTISFRPKKTKKKLKQVVIPIHPDLEAALLEAPGVGTAPVFPSLHGKMTGGKYGLSQQFSAIMAKAGVSPKITQHTPTGRKNTSLSFHSLRHSFTSALANAGVSPELRMKLTGHTKADTHAGYTHHEMEPLRAAVASMPALVV